MDYGKNIIARIQKERYFLLRPPVTYIFSNPVMDRVLEKFGFVIEQRHRDIRYMTPEKILTLLSWRWAYRLARALRIHRIRIPVYAYPSSIVVARKPK